MVVAEAVTSAELSATELAVLLAAELAASLLAAELAELLLQPTMASIAIATIATEIFFMVCKSSYWLMQAAALVCRRQ